MPPLETEHDRNNLDDRAAATPQNLPALTGPGIGGAQIGTLTEHLLAVRAHLDRADARFEQMERRLERVDAGLNQIAGRVNRIDAKLDRLEKKRG